MVTGFRSVACKPLPMLAFVPENNELVTIEVVGEPKRN